MRSSIRALLCVLLSFFLFCLPALAVDGPLRSKGQTLYVPAYSHVVHGDREQPFQLAATLTVRNADPSHALSLQSVEYRDSKGSIIRRYVETPRPIPPFASAEFVVGESDKRGGLGASFIVRWKADTAIITPVVETILIGTAASQGISFVGEARVIEDQGG